MCITLGHWLCNTPTPSGNTLRPQLLYIFSGRLPILLFQVNPLVNAVVQTAFAKALDEANRIDELMISDGFNSDPRYTVENMPYLGVPMTCKEIIFCKVYLVQCNCTLYKLQCTQRVLFYNSNQVH